jgi:mannose-6-phosphate isomerase
MHFTPNSPDEKIQPKDDLAIPLNEIHHTFRRKLFQDMLPLWSSLGVDHIQGGFCESISLDGTVPEVNRRIRVSARQVYVFAESARLGLNPIAATACILHGHHFLSRHSSQHGLIYHNISRDGCLIDLGHDLYDQAFLLLSYASAYRHTGNRDFAHQASISLASIRTMFTHSLGGFVDHTVTLLPLRANPHMHLLEAALAWMAIDNSLDWRFLADELVDLFQTRFFDPHHGVVQETFDANWKAITEGGKCKIEPGHNFEWGWLLMRWQEMTGKDIGGRAQNLISFAETFGYDPSRQVAVNECWSDGSSLDRTARLWPQTERLKAWLAVATCSQGTSAKRQAQARALDAARGLLAYFPSKAPGLWHDVMLEDGTFKTGPAPASSLYHIVCAYSALYDYVGTLHATEDDNAPRSLQTIARDRAVELSA